MKQINEKLYVNEDKVQSVQKIEDQYYLITSFGSSINISEELFDDLKEYEGSGGGGGGGATLNLAYGLTPPEDTTKIWVKCEEPTTVKVEANRQLVVSSNENAKVVATDTIGTTRLYSNVLDFTANKLVKKNGKTYLIGAGAYNSSIWWYGNALSSSEAFRIYEADNTTYSVPYKPASAQQLGIWEKDDDTILVLYGDANSKTTILTYTISTASYVKLTTSLGVAMFKQSCYKDNYFYGIQTSSTNNHFYKMALDGTSQDVVKNLPTGFSNSNQLGSCQVIGDYIYFIIYNTSETAYYMARFNMSDMTNSSIETLTKWTYNNESFKNYTMHYYGNKLIITDMRDDLNATKTNPTCHIVALYDVITNQWEVIDITWAYGGSFVYVDNNTGNIEIIGGYPTAKTTKKITINNIYTLTENTLDLFYDTYYNRNLRLVNEDILTIDAPIDHAWIGDANNIAQPVELRYYEDDLWWGVNCLGWTQLSSAVIAASDVSIDLNSATTDTQTITITLTWGNQTGETTTNISTSDDTIATASLSGDSLTITGVAVGTATITISVVDEYGTTFTKSITATITNSGA